MVADLPDAHDQGEKDARLMPYAPVLSGRSALVSLWMHIFSPIPTAKLRASKMRRRGILALWVSGLPLYLAAAIIVGWTGWAAQDMPDRSVLWAHNDSPSIVMLDRHGREIFRTGGREMQPVRLNDLPPHVTQAVLAIEDRRFYDHPGFDIIGLARAVQANRQAGRVVQGGSTITQQLAKNIFLTRSQTLKRKTQEVLLAVWLEGRFTKQQILELYLSRVYFGGGTVGLASGAQRFFNKSPVKLTVGEAALLAGLLKAPDRLNPLKNKQANARRTARVLLAMERQGYISNIETSNALQSPIKIEPVAVNTHASLGYFSDWILGVMDREIGAPRGDVVVHTSLDLAAQLAAQKAVTQGLSTPLAQERNAQQAALIALDGTGGVRAMIGGVDYQHSSYNRAVSARRQPGSAFKPFVYVAALQAGLTPWDVRIDEPIDIEGWQPGNFKNKFLGPLTLEKALALSVNTVAVKLSEYVGREAVVATAKNLGLGGLKPYRSIALGAQETSLLALSAAYTPFANWGYGAKPYGLEAIYSADGKMLFRREAPVQNKVLDVKVLEQMNTMLKTVIAEGTGRAARLEGRDAAGKTGTTNDYRDAWFVGYVPDYIAGVWVGNDDNSKMARITGGMIPAQIWQNFMQEVLKNQPSRPLPLSVRPKTSPLLSATIKEQKSLEFLLAELERSLP